jgi:hypothetical protein
VRVGRRGRAVARSTSAAQHGADARHQFPRIKWLGKIIVGADLEADDAVHIFSARRQQQHRQLRRRANPPQDFKTVDAGQHHIQHCQKIFAGCGLLQSAFAIVDAVDCEALGLQIFSHQVAEFHVIVDYKNSFHWSPKK